MFFRGQMIGKYRIDASLGSGGFGTVYLAEDTWMQSRVAIKVPHRQQPDLEEMLHEPRLLASLDHPNIVRVLTAERQEDVFFIVMEYVPGETLEQLVLREGALELPQALDFTCQICNGVDHAHQAGVLHRDLRPGNMLVASGGRLKVTDFGTSRFLEVAARGTTIIGSPPYMAPEQFHGRAVFASDVYSIGVTMYQMLTGDLPYESPTPHDLERLERGELVTAPRLRNGRIPQAINDIVLRALAPDPTARYTRASDLWSDVMAARRSVGTPTPARIPVPAVPAAPAAAVVTPPAPEARVDVRPRPPLRVQAEPAAARLCWHCHKALHARADRCLFCGETQ